MEGSYTLIIVSWNVLLYTTLLLIDWQTCKNNKLHKIKNTEKTSESLNIILYHKSSYICHLQSLFLIEAKIIFRSIKKDKKI